MKQLWRKALLLVASSMLVVAGCATKQKTVVNTYPDSLVEKSRETLILSFRIFQKPTDLEKAQPEFSGIKYKRYEVVGIIQDVFNLSRHETADESWHENHVCKFELDNKTYEATVSQASYDTKKKVVESFMLSAGQVVYESQQKWGYASHFSIILDTRKFNQGSLMVVEPEYYQFDAVLINSQKVNEWIESTDLYSYSGQIVKQAAMDCKKEKKKVTRIYIGKV